MFINRESQVIMRRIVFWFTAVLFSNTIYSQTYSLEQCINTSIESNLDLESAKLYTDQLYQNEKAARAEFMPTVGLYANHSFANGGIQNSTTGSIDNESYQYGDAGISAQMTLFEGMRRVEKKKQESVNYTEGTFNLEKAQNEIAVQVAMVYLNILYAKSVIKNIESQIDVTEQQIKRTEAMVKAGSTTKAELLRLQYSLAEEQVQLTKNRNDMSVHKLELMQIMNLNVDSVSAFDIDAAVNIDISADLLFSVDSVYASATGIMPEIAAAKANIQSNEYGVNIARGAYYPTVKMNCGYGSDYTSLRSDSYSQQYGDYATAHIGINVSVPIFNKGLTKISVDKSKISVLESENRLCKVEQQLYKTIQLAYNDAVAAAESYLTQERALSFRSESYRLAEKQFQAGALSSFDYNIEKAEYLKAQNDLEQSKYWYVFKTVLYNFYATGKVSL